MLGEQGQGAGEDKGTAWSQGVLLPGEVLILLKYQRQAAEDLPNTMQRQYDAVLELKIILGLNLAIPPTDSCSFNQHWAGLLHQSKKCSNAQLSLSWRVLAKKSSITNFPYF